MFLEQPRRIPTIVALGILLLMGAGVFSINRLSPLFSRATEQASTAPREVFISNVTDSSFVLSWMTDVPTQGVVVSETEAGSRTFYDIRDREDQVAKAYKTHYVEITGLPTAASVTYSLVSGGKPRQTGAITLGPSLGTPPSALPVYGVVTTADRQETQGTIVVVTPRDGSSWSAFIRQTNSWAVSLAALRTPDFQSYFCTEFDCNRSIPATIGWQAEEGVSTSTVTLDQLRPFPATVMLGSDPSLSFGDVVPEQPFEQPSPLPTSRISSPSSVPAVRSAHTSDSPDAQNKIQILNPKSDAKLTFPKPLIRGLGVPGEDVVITLESPLKQTGTVTVGPDGTWFWTPKQALSPGEHTLRIETFNTKGQRVVLASTFYLLPSGQQVLGEATPSGTVTPSPTPTTGVPTPTQTPTPTLAILSPTATPTATLTATVTPIRTITPTPTLPPSGGVFPGILVIGGGFTLLLISLALL